MQQKVLQSVRIYFFMSTCQGFSSFQNLTFAQLSHWGHASNNPKTLSSCCRYLTLSQVSVKCSSSAVSKQVPLRCKWASPSLVLGEVTQTLFHLMPGWFKYASITLLGGVIKWYSLWIFLHWVSVTHEGTAGRFLQSWSFRSMLTAEGVKLERR